MNVRFIVFLSLLLIFCRTVYADDKEDYVAYGYVTSVVRDVTLPKTMVYFDVVIGSDQYGKSQFAPFECVAGTVGFVVIGSQYANGYTGNSTDGWLLTIEAATAESQLNAAVLAAAKMGATEQFMLIYNKFPNGDCVLKQIITSRA